MRLRRTGKRGNKVRSRNTRKRQTLRRKFRGGNKPKRQKPYEREKPYAARPLFFDDDDDGRIQAWDDRLRYNVFINFRENMENMIENQHNMIRLLEAIKGQNSNSMIENQNNMIRLLEAIKKGQNSNSE